MNAETMQALRALKALLPSEDAAILMALLDAKGVNAAIGLTREQIQDCTGLRYSTVQERVKSLLRRGLIQDGVQVHKWITGEVQTTLVLKEGFDA